MGKAIKTDYFRRNQIIFSRGDRSDSIFYIQKGSVKLALTSRQGKEAVIAVLTKGNFFGDSAFASERPPRQSSAVALMNVYALRIDANAMLELIYHDEDVCNVIISSLISVQTKIIRSLADKLLYSSEERLARALSSIAEFDQNVGLRQPLNLSQQDLANMIGVSRQRVNFVLQRFKNSGFVDYDHGLNVHRSILEVMEKD